MFILQKLKSLHPLIIRQNFATQSQLLISQAHPHLKLLQKSEKIL